jgi:hypothetical protein
MDRPRTISVKSTDGNNTSVVVTVVRGYVWMSIRPLFTWEAIMEPTKVDELIQVLELAREDATTMLMAQARRVATGSGEAPRAITKGSS